MAEKIVSPGVFTEEKDLSFLPQGIGEIGAAFIGPTVKGPAFVPTIVESGNEFVQKFGPTQPTMYTPYAVQNYLKNSGKATIVRTLGIGGYKVQAPIYLTISGSGFTENLISVLHPTFVAINDDDVDYFEQSRIAVGAGGTADFVLTVSGSYGTDSSTFTNAINKNGNSFSASLDPNDGSNVGDIFGFLPTGIEPAYNYVLFNDAASASLAAGTGDAIVKMYTGSLADTEWDFQSDYQAARTPWLTSQKVGGNTQNLFRFHHMSHGDNTNYEFKAQIENIRPAGTIPGSDYGAFNVVIRTVDQDNIYGSPYAYDDSDSRPNVIETFLNCNLNPNSPNFIQRKIGDKYITVDATGKLTSNGDYSNKSAYIRVEVADPVIAGALSSNLVPFGFAAPYSPIPDGITQPTACTYVQNQDIGGIYNKKKPFGFDFNATDNYNYLKALPVDADLSSGNNVAFYLGDFNQPASANTPTAAAPYSGAIGLTSDTSAQTRKFIIPFQGGFDGWRPHLQKRTGTNILAANSQGFNLTSGEWGDTAYRRALAAISNPDEFDINMLVTPGILTELHSGLTARAIEVCEDRSDAFYVMDGFALESNIASAISTMQTVDTNYAGVYYPWIKTLDVNLNKPMWVPPSVVMPGIIAYSDKVSEPWFAPAGLNRGGISEAIEAYTRLTHDERDDLYENRINPIASFPNEGVVAWGQKTLQAKPSALDRINVRRLMIALKKFIASSSRYLIFENNTAVTRNRFLNIVNPYLESVQQRQGLYAFKVVMDESNNTPDIIDRNIMYGQIFLQPAKTAEFIVLDFNILPTGAAFPE
jgi:hypothetical protein